MTAVPLNTFIYSTISPDQVRHRLTDDGWSILDFGVQRIQIPRGDLSRIRAARELATAIAAQAGFWDQDLAELERELLAAEDAKAAAETSGPQDPPATDSIPAADPALDLPYGGDDPVLDARVKAVATMPESRRRRTR